jgi:F0F1-type ATP synthase assembly protein I
MHAAGPYLGLGLQLAGTMVVYILLGYLADRWLGTDPWLLLAGAGLGMLAFFVQLFRIVRRMNAASSGASASEETGSPDSI